MEIVFSVTALDLQLFRQLEAAVDENGVVEQRDFDDGIVAVVKLVAEQVVWVGVETFVVDAVEH